MSISNETRKTTPAAGDGVNKTFSFAFKIFATSELTVVKTDDVGVETTLSETTNYVVSLNADQDSNPGGSITIVPGDPAPTSLELITMTSEVPNTQSVTLTNQGGFYPAVLNNAIDRAVILVQQVLDKVGRSVKIPISDATGVNTILPTEGIRADKVLAFDSLGNVIVLAFGAVSTSIDAIFTGLADGDYIRYDGTNWLNRTASETISDMAIPTLAGNNAFTGDITFAGKVSFLDDGELTIATGAITVTGVNHTLDTEGGAASDDLDTINGGVDGLMITLRIENDAREIVFKDGTGNIETPDGLDITISDDENAISLIYDAALSKWLVQSVFAVKDLAATETSAGLVERATDAEVSTGTDTTRYTTPKQLADKDGGKVLGQAYVATGALISSSTAIPQDDTIPQNTEGVEVLPLAYTPVSATSKLVIEFGCPISCGSNQELAVALFIGTTAGALCATGAHVGAGATGSLTSLYEETSGSTTSRTYKIRAGGTGSTVYINGSAGVRKFGGVSQSYIKITEIEV